MALSYTHGIVLSIHLHWVSSHPLPPLQARQTRTPTTQPLESSLRSETQRKFLLQPPLPRLQSRTGPKESRRTSRLSKDDEVISSSLRRGHRDRGGVKASRCREEH